MEAAAEHRVAVHPVGAAAASAPAAPAAARRPRHPGHRRRRALRARPLVPAAAEPGGARRGRPRHPPAGRPGRARRCRTPWADAVERAADPPGPALGDALDRAVVGTSLLARVPIWWRVVGLAQLVLAVAAVVGFALAGALRRGRAGPSSTRSIGDPPTLGVVPVPLVLLVVGLLGGLLLALVSRWLARIGARRRGRVMDAPAARLDRRGRAGPRSCSRSSGCSSGTRRPALALQPRRRRLTPRRPQARRRRAGRPQGRGSSLSRRAPGGRGWSQRPRGTGPGEDAP